MSLRQVTTGSNDAVREDLICTGFKRGTGERHDCSGSPAFAREQGSVVLVCACLPYLGAWELLSLFALICPSRAGRCCILAREQDSAVAAHSHCPGKASRPACLNEPGRLGVQNGNHQCLCLCRDFQLSPAPPADALRLADESPSHVAHAVFNCYFALDPRVGETAYELLFFVNPHLRTC